MKTKFADGVGHLCHYCSVRCCARCGGRVTLRNNKVRQCFHQIIVQTNISLCPLQTIWVCMLCRKKQELLSKTGQWMTKQGSEADGFFRPNVSSVCIVNTT